MSAERIPGGAVALTSGPGGLWCGYTLREDSTLRVINLENAELVFEFVPPERRCYGLSQLDGMIWFLGNEWLYEIDPRGRVRNRIARTYETMHGLAAAPDGFYTMVFQDGSNYLVKFEPGGDEISRFRSTVQNPTAMSFDGQHFWITDRIDGFIHVIDREREREIDLFPTPVASPTGIAHLNGNIALVDNGPEGEDDFVYIIDPEGEDGPKLLPISRHYDFGQVQTFSSESVGFTLFNVGNAELTIESARLADGDAGFSIANIQDLEIMPGRYHNLRVTFDPNTYELYTDTLIVNSNDPEEPVVRVVFIGLGVFSTRRLGHSPQTLDFGLVRADPWRDGTRHRVLSIYNMGRDPLVVDAIEHRIREIFRFEPVEFPVRLETAESLAVDFWFEPHNGIQYLDTLLIYSNEIRRINRVFMRGTGSDSVYSEGAKLWSFELSGGDNPGGAIIPFDDINDDDITDLIAVSAEGTVYGLNGFASENADQIWTQEFVNRPYAPAGALPTGNAIACGDVNSDGVQDAIIASGMEDHSVYGISGIDGEELWRWDIENIGGAGRVALIVSGYDMNGDGGLDPVLLIRPAYNQGPNRLARIDGTTGRPVWTIDPGMVIGLAAISDFDQDGVADFVAISYDDRIVLISGANGSLIRSVQLNTAFPMMPAPVTAIGDINEDGRSEALFMTSNSQLTAFSLHDSEIEWQTGQMGIFQLRGPLKFLLDFGMDLTDDGINEIAGCDNADLAFVLDPTNGSAVWVAQIRNVSSMTVAEDCNQDGIKDVAFGFGNGGILCKNGLNGRDLWGYENDADSEILNLTAFEDVDFGGSPDLIAMFDDGMVHCISSGGDLNIEFHPSENVPKILNLSEIYPNPFNGRINLSFGLSKESEVTFSIWNMNGRRVFAKELGIYGAGTHSFSFDPIQQRAIPNGTYIFRMEGDRYHIDRKGILLK